MSIIVGVDEVGRGPLVGDVVAAAVILPVGCNLPLMDSKKLSEKKRIALDILIREQAVAFSIGIATPEEIDEINILQATMLAMKRAIESIGVEYDAVQVDGNRCPNITAPCEAIIKGDGSVMVISAASIIAKVYRDNQMKELDLLYPEYGFAKHKGYPTKDHMEKMKQFGLIPAYRKSFKPVAKLV